MSTRQHPPPIRPKPQLLYKAIYGSQPRVSELTYRQTGWGAPAPLLSPQTQSHWETRGGGPVAAVVGGWAVGWSRYCFKVERAQDGCVWEENDGGCIRLRTPTTTYANP